MSNSPLVTYTRISPNKTVNRTHTIDTISIHCVVGQLSVETIGSIFANSSVQSSSNYAIGSDSRIGMYVEEKDRSWCTSSKSNDHRAITIEVACDKTHPYKVKDSVYDTLITLLVDICKRNNIPKLLWRADKSLIGQVEKQNMTVHRWFANKSCPGDYLYSLHYKIAESVNLRLSSIPTQGNISLKFEDISLNHTYNYIGNKQYVSASSSSGSMAEKSLVIVTNKYVPGAKHPIHVRAIDETGKFTKGVYGWVDVSDLVLPSTPLSQKVKVTASALNIRSGPGTDYKIVGVIKDKGVYTIVETSNNWGKLKSQIGWISLDYTQKL